MCVNCEKKAGQKKNMKTHTHRQQNSRMLMACAFLYSCYLVCVDLMMQYFIDIFSPILIKNHQMVKHHRISLPPVCVFRLTLDCSFWPVCFLSSNNSIMKKEEKKKCQEVTRCKQASPKWPVKLFASNDDDQYKTNN